jgi:hypothetical protein
LLIFLITELEKRGKLVGKKSKEERNLSVDHISTLKINNLGINKFHLIRGVS